MPSKLVIHMKLCLWASDGNTVATDAGQNDAEAIGELLQHQ